MKEFVSYQDGVLKTICHVYQHEDGRTLHLLPIIHVGEKRYYEELLEYVGEKICVYESMKINVDDVENEQSSVIPHSFNEWFQYNENLAKEIDANLGPEIKKFQRKYKIFKGFTRKTRRLVKRNLGVADNRLTKLFYQLERTNFALHNMTVQQNLLAEFLELSYQFNVIDYFNDIPNRKNWIHGDLVVQIHDASISKAKETLKNPPPGFVELTKTNADQFYAMIYLIESMIQLSISDRRKKMSEIFTNIEQENIPEDYITSRNNIIIETADNLFDEYDDVVIFYGAAHMSGIKIQAEKAGFKQISTSEFVVYKT
jgi:hypothetical protein